MDSEEIIQVILEAINHIRKNQYQRGNGGIDK